MKNIRKGFPLHRAHIRDIVPVMPRDQDHLSKFDNDYGISLLDKRGSRMLRCVGELMCARE